MHLTCRREDAGRQETWTNTTASTYLTAEDLPHVGVGDEGAQQSDAVFHSCTGASKTVAGLPA